MKRLLDRRWQGSRSSSPSAARRGARPAATGSWAGRYTLGGPDDLAVTLSGKQRARRPRRRRTPISSRCPLSTAGGRIRFQLPGRPAPLVFDGAIAKRALAGTVRQGALAGRSRRGPAAAPACSRAASIAPAERDRGRRRRPVRPGATRRPRLGPRARALPVRRARSRSAPGSRRAHRRPARPRSAPTAAQIDGRAARRLRVRQLEVRFRSGGGRRSRERSRSRPAPGKHAAVAFVHGSGPTVRAYLPELSALLLRHGVAVLVYDKRGIGQSGGRLPRASRRPRARSTRSHATLRPRRASSPRSRRSTAHGSGSRGRARRAGSRRSPPRASRRSGSSCSSPGPAVTADENDLYQDLAGEGERPPAALGRRDRRRGAEARPGRRRPDPVDPQAEDPGALAVRRQDTFVPPRLSERRLAPIAAEPGRDFTVVDFPNANHALVETTTGPHVGDAPLGHVRAGPLRPGRRLAPRPRPRAGRSGDANSTPVIAALHFVRLIETP